MTQDHLDSKWESFTKEICRLANSQTEITQHLNLFSEDERVLFADTFSRRRLIIEFTEEKGV